MHLESQTKETVHHRLRLRSPFCLRRRRNLRTILIAVFSCSFLLYNYSSYHHNDLAQKFDGAQNVPCPQSPIAKDILLVLRTGATESLAKLPVHFDTTLACVPDYIIYSDFAETIADHPVYDVFSDINATLLSAIPEFVLHAHLKRHGRDGLNTTLHFGSGPTGSPENTAWKLDRFKFLPMIDRALKHRPHAKWFVFIEADTYLMWANVLDYLSKFNPEDALYIGKHMYIGDVLFAHGGSGFILSNPAMRKVSDHRNAHVAAYDQYTIDNWAGDMVLGKALRDVDVGLISAWPHFQGDPVAALDHRLEKIGRRPWCYAPVTYHHMREEEIEKLWAFEQAWWRGNRRTLLHRDVFREYIFPKLRSESKNWDNLCADSEASQEDSLEKCQAVCGAKPNCLQYRFAAGRCFTSTEVRLGEEADVPCVEYSTAASKCIRWTENTAYKKNIQSGWMLKRILQYVEDMDRTCPEDARQQWVI